MKNNRGFLKILASLLMGMFFLFSNGASASTLQVDLDHILSPDADGFYQICWLGRTDSETLPLRQKMQAYLELQLERAGLRLRFFEDCLTAPRPMFPVGIGFFDAIDNPEGIKNTLLGTTQLNPYPGHPTTYHMGDWAHKDLVDMVLTTHFQSVHPNLQAQLQGLSAQGQENLLLSIVLHEFLHALGFSHEQNHPQSTCTTGQDNYTHLYSVTAYDERSIMNYCQTHHFDFEKGPLPLSELDVAGIRIVYLMAQ